MLHEKWIFGGKKLKWKRQSPVKSLCNYEPGLRNAEIRQASELFFTEGLATKAYTHPTPKKFF